MNWKPPRIGALISGFLLTAACSLAAPSAEVLFLKHCSSCHGKDGKGKTPIGRKLGAKDLAASKTTPAEIEKQVSDGMVDSSGTVKMPAYRGKLTSEEIRELVDYVQRLRK